MKKRMKTRRFETRQHLQSEEDWVLGSLPEPDLRSVLFKIKNERSNPVEEKELTPKYKTMEFWITVALTVVSFLLISGVVEPGSGFDKALAALIMGATSFGYSIKRGYIKMPVKNNKPGYQTTEFWLSLTSALTGITLASNAVDDMDQTSQVLASISVALAGLGYGPSRVMAKKAAPPVLILILLFGCAALQPSKIQKGAEISQYSVTAPEYMNYVMNDPKLTDTQKKNRALNLYTWGDRLGEDISFIPYEFKDGKFVRIIPKKE